MRILVIEDEIPLLNTIEQHLVAENFQVDTASDGDDGYYQATEYPIDAAIIDVGLPGMNGIEITQKLRQSGNTTPILILTARSRWQQKVEGLEAGADDYLTKPFQMEELVARLKALLRRATKAASEELSCKGLTLNLQKQQAWLNQQLLELTLYEYRLLEYLMRHADEAVSKTKLSDYLYPHDEDRDSNVIEVLIGRVRKKIDPNAQLKPIETLRGRGYRFTLFDNE